MDRRRYLPRMDGLETRVVLSTTGGASAAASQAAIARANASAAAAVESPQHDTTSPQGTSVKPAVVVTTTPNAKAKPGAKTPTVAAAPPTAAWQQTRIERLPLLFQQTSRTRIVPPALVQSLQANLTQISNSLHRPKPSGLRAFNDQLRATISRTGIRQEDAVQLNALFGKILADAGCTPERVQKFQADMSELARINSFQRTSANLVASDYGLVLQVALGVGVVRPGAKPS